MKTTHYIYLIIFALVLIWSGINPKDQFTWFLEVVPAIIGLVIILCIHRKYPLTDMLYSLILIHSIILMVGGHYTYAEVPLFDWLAEQFNWQRNNYDKVGHLAQGFIPAIITREIFIRNTVINNRIWQNIIIVCVCLAFSALYELIEWWVALATGENADAFLGTQGYAWDTQSDMFLALLGAIAALLCLSKMHDKALAKLRTKESLST